jgi:hypothetical protein
MFLFFDVQNLDFLVKLVAYGSLFGVVAVYPYFYKVGSSLSLHVLLNQEFLSSKHVEQLRNIGIINSTTRSHLVGYFYTICIMVDRSMNFNTTRSLFYIVRQQGNLWHFLRHSALSLFYIPQNAIYFIILYF